MDYKSTIQGFRETRVALKVAFDLATANARQCPDNELRPLLRQQARGIAQLDAELVEFTAACKLFHALDADLENARNTLGDFIRELEGEANDSR